jgi:hypothetical protein
MKKLALALVFIGGAAFAQGIPIKDQNSSTAADVAACGGSLNCVQVDTGQASASAGYARIADDLGRALTVGDSTIRSLVTSATRTDYANQIEGAALDARILNSVTTTMTIAQATGFITLNNSAITTTSTNARITTHQVFPYFDTQGLAYAWTFKRPSGQNGQTNEVVEMGAFNGSGGTAPTDGLLFRWNAAGEFRAVSVYNSTESQSSVLTNPTSGSTHIALIVRRATGTDFWIDNVKVASIEEATQSNPVSVRSLPFTARVYVGGASPATAPQLLIGPHIVRRYGDMDKNYHDILAGQGAHSAQAPTTAFAQTSNHANSTSPTSATLSNTAAGYTTLGGRYQFAAPAGAATDFALFGYQVPAGYQLYVTSVSINTCNTGAAVATTATVLDWGIGVNSTAVSLATTDSFGPPFSTMAPRRIPIGSQGFSLVAPNGPAQIGDCAADLVRTFDPPVVVQSSRFFHVIVQVPVGTATASQVIRGDVMINGYFE